MITLHFYLAIIAFLASITGGIYFLTLWFRYEKKHTLLLYWAFGFGFLLLFKIPNILANTELTIVQHDIYAFFFVTLLLYFLAYPLFIEGLSTIRPFRYQKLFVLVGRILFPFSAVYFFFSFFVSGFDISYAPVWVSHLLFFIPAQLFLFFRLWDIARQATLYPVISKIGAQVAMLGTVGLFTTSILYVLVQVGSVQRILWYVSVVSSPWISALQIITITLLFFGFRSMALKYLQNNK